MSGGVSWFDVKSMTGEEDVHDLAGVWMDSTRDPETRVHVVWAGWDCWSVFDDETLLDGGLHRAGESELIQGGRVIWRGEAKLHGPQRMRGFIDGPFIPGEMRGAVLGVEEIEWSSRRCLNVTARNDADEPGTVTIDQATGWVLRIEVGSMARGFAMIRINEGADPPQLGSWEAVDPPARPGTVYLADDDGDRRFGGHLDVDAGPAGAMFHGPRGVFIDEALDWAGQQANRVSVRWGTRFFSGGEADLGYPPVPVDEIKGLG
jgi:hypothetical protein